MKNNENSSQFVFGKYVVILACIATAVAMLRLIAWSFGQTWEWFHFMDESITVTYVSLCFAVIFTFGQNVATFFFGMFNARNKELQRKLDGYKHAPDPSLGDAYVKYKNIEDDCSSAKVASYFWFSLFLIFAAVDAWTNIDQMNADQAARGVTNRQLFNYISGTALVFFEEGLGLVISALGHTVNSVREIHGKKRFAWLDVFSKGATDVLSGGLGGEHNRPAPSLDGFRGGIYKQHDQQNTTSSQSQERPRSGPAYHPAGLANGGVERK